MRRKNVCRFRNLPIEFDEVIVEQPQELGNGGNLPAVTEFENCSKYSEVECARFGCLLDPTSGLGGAVPFSEG